MQGPGVLGTSNKVDSRYADKFDNEIASLEIKDSAGNTICNDLETAYQRGMIDKDADGKYRLKYYAANDQYYLTVKDASGSMWFNDTYTVKLRLKSEIKLDEDGVAELPSGTNSTVRFFFAYGSSSTDPQYVFPNNNSPVMGAAAVIDSLYVDVINTEALLEIMKTGTYNATTKEVTYNAAIYNTSPSAVTGEIIDEWPTSLKLKGLSGVANTRITLYFTDGTSQVIDQTASSYSYTGTKTVNRIVVTGFTLPAATLNDDGTVATMGTKNIKIIGITDEDTPFTVGNSITDGSGNSSSVERLVLADCITKKVYSDAACTDPIEGVETVRKGQTVYFKITLKNTSRTASGTPQALPFRITDYAQAGMTLVSATYSDGTTTSSIDLSALESVPYDPKATSFVTVNNMFPEVTIPGNGTGTWILAFTIDESCEVTQLKNLVNAYAYVRDESTGYNEAFRTQNAEASITLETDRSADISIDKQVSQYVYHEGCYAEDIYGEGEGRLSGTYVTKSNEYDVGDYVLYQIGVKNASTAANEAPIYYLYDVLPDGLEYVGIADGWQSPIRPNDGTTRDRRGVWWVWGHFYDPSTTSTYDYGPKNDYGTTVATGNNIAYAYKKKVIAVDNSSAGGTADIFRTTSISGSYAAKKELAGTVQYAGTDEQGRLIFNVKELDGTALYLAPGEEFWFHVVCRVTSAPSTTDEDGKPVFKNTVGAQSIAWAIAGSNDIEYVQDDVDVFFKHYDYRDDIEKTADAYSFESGSSTSQSGLVTVSQMANIRYNITIINRTNPQNNFEKIMFYDKIPENYTYRDGSLIYANDAGTSRILTLSEVNYDPETNTVFAEISSEHNTDVYNRIYNKAQFHLVYWVEPTQEGKTTYHSDTNVAYLGSGPRATWTTYALGSYGVILSKSQTIRGDVYKTSTPVMVHEREKFTYTLSATPVYESQYAISNWTKTWENLPVYEGGVKIVYSVEETLPNGSVYVKSGDDVTLTATKTDSGKITITNSYTPEVTKVTVEKLWSDANDQDGKRSSVGAKVQLFKTVGQTKTSVSDKFDVGTADNWTKTWENLPVYEGGVKIVYSVEETLPDGSVYEKSGDEVTLTAKATDSGKITITNTYTPETVDIKVIKIWDDADNQDGMKPEKLEVTLSNGDSVTLNAENQWTAEIKGLPKYANGQLVNYTWSEDTVPDGYTMTKSEKDETGYITSITNTHETDKISVNVEKQWRDDDNRDGLRPQSIKVQLKANGTAHGEPVVLDESNSWKHTWTELDKNAAGAEIAYTVEEIDLPAGYGIIVNGSAKDGYLIINPHDPEKIELNGVKIWEGETDAEHQRPASVTIRLFANGSEIKSATVTAADGWTFKFTDLYKFEKGKEIVYSITEDKVVGYATRIEGMKVTNTWQPPENPPTGDKRYFGTAALIFTSLTGAVIAMRKLRRRREDAE